MLEVQRFAEEAVKFTARKYNGDGDLLDVLVVDVDGEDRWWDLYLDVVPRTEFCQTEYLTPTTPATWPDADGFALVFQKAVVKHEIEGPVPIQFREIVLLTDPQERAEAARQIIGDFDRSVAARAAGYNAVIFLHHDLALKRAATADHYLARLIVHECLNIVEEASGLILVNGHDPSEAFDLATLETFEQFKEEVGEDDLKRRYPTLF
jgi:hypothetical protein